MPLYPLLGFPGYIAGVPPTLILSSKPEKDNNNNSHHVFTACYAPGLFQTLVGV